MLIEKPSSGNTANVPISDTGTASIGISVARQFCRNRKTTMTTRIMRLCQRLDDLLDALRDRQRRIEGVDEVEVARESLAQQIHLFADAGGDFERVRARRLEDGDADAGLAVDAADLLVVRAPRARCVRRPSGGRSIRRRSSAARCRRIPQASAAGRARGRCRSSPVRTATGRAPTWPDGFTELCCWMARDSSGTVSPSAASRSGLTQMRIA